MNQGISKIDAENINQSHIWELIEQEVLYQIDFERNRLEEADNPADVKDMQERIRALRRLLRLPQDAIDREE